MDRVNITIHDTPNITMKMPEKSCRPNPVAMGIFLVSALFISIAFKQILVTYQEADIVYVARLVENGEPISSHAVAFYAKQASAIVEQDICRSDVVKSGLSVILKNLDAQQPEADYERWATTLQEADTYLTHALSCLPTNGNLWLRLAMVRLTMAEQPDEIARLLSHAQWLAPSEINELSSRLKIWNRVSASTLAKASSSVLSDLLLVQRNKPYPELTVQRPSVMLQPYIEEAKRLSASSARN